MFRYPSLILPAQRALSSIQYSRSTLSRYTCTVASFSAAPPSASGLLSSTLIPCRLFTSTSSTNETLRPTNDSNPPLPPLSSSPPPPLRPPDFTDDEPDWTTTSSPPPNLPHEFGSNQYMYVDDGLKEHLRTLLWQFRAPIRYAFAYGSGVFSQGTKSQRPMIDLIFCVTYTQHWHSVNIAQHRNHYSFLGSLGSKVVSHVQDDFGAGVYFNPYVEVNGTLIKYGVVNLTTLHQDLTNWDTLYLAGRLHKPVRILRDDPRIRYANQLNLLSALRTALLLLPETFTEQQLYTTISNISYTGDIRMSMFAENPNKVSNIVTHQLHNFRRLYFPLIEILPNLTLVNGAQQAKDDSPITTKLKQDMHPTRRANMIRRLPTAFRDKLYFQYQARYKIPRGEFQAIVGHTEDEERVSKREAGEFEKRIVGDSSEGGIEVEVAKAVKKTISWPSSVQSVKGVFTAGMGRSVRYVEEKMGKWREGRDKHPIETSVDTKDPDKRTHT